MSIRKSEFRNIIRKKNKSIIDIKSIVSEKEFEKFCNKFKFFSCLIGKKF
jgi:hypothetical protein